MLKESKDSFSIANLMFSQHYLLFLRERAAPAETAITTATAVKGSAVAGAVVAGAEVAGAEVAGAEVAGAEAAAPPVAEVALRRIPLEPQASSSSVEFLPRIPVPQLSQPL